MVPKRILVSALGSFAISLFALPFAGSASATPFGGGSHAGFSSLDLSLFQLTPSTVSFSSVGSSSLGGSGFGRVDFVWTGDPGGNVVGGNASDLRSERAFLVLSNLENFHRFVHIRNPRGDTKPGRDPAPAIPEPSAAIIFAAGLAVVGLRRRRS